MSTSKTTLVFGVAVACSLAIAVKCIGDDIVGTRLLADVSETYGLEIVKTDARFSSERERGTIRGAPVFPEDVKRYAPLFARELFLYPPNAVKRARLKRIVLCRDLSYRRILRAGIPDFANSTLYLDVSLPWPNRRYQCAVIHHEFFHLLDWADDGVVTHDTAWASLNAVGIVYGDESRKGDDPREAEFSTAFPGFLTRYCLTAVEEDKAEVYSHLMVNAAYVQKRAENDPILRAKVRMLKRVCNVFCSEMDDAFWKSARRTQRPGSDPAVEGEGGRKSNGLVP